MIVSTSKIHGDREARMIKRLLDNYREIFYHTVLAALIGVLVGALDTLFGKVLLYITDFRDSRSLFLIPFLPVAGIVIVLLYRKFSSRSLKGMSLIFETGHGKSEKIPKSLIPLVMVSTWITHLFGGSAGREGVAVQLGAAISHTIGRYLKLPKNSRVLLVAGMAAGFAGLFQTPIAATFFALEVLVAGSIMYEALLPALAAAFVASYTSSFLGLEKFAILVKDEISMDPLTVVKIILVAIVFGIVGGAFASVLSRSRKFFAGKVEDPVRRIFIIGSLVAVLLLILQAGRYAGLGTNLIASSFGGEDVYIYDWLLKFALTILTLSAGYQGGEVTPLFAIGSTLGIVLAKLLGLPPMLTAALGYTAVFGSATNTLFAPMLIGAEVFGAGNILYFAIVCSIAYVFNGNRTIYSLQKKYSYLDSLN